MSELFQKVTMRKLDPASLPTKGNPLFDQLREEVKQRMDLQILARSKEIDLRNSLEKTRRSR